MDMNSKITAKILEAHIAAKHVAQLREIFEEYNIVDLTEEVSLLTLEESLFLFKTLKKDVTADLFSYLDSDKQEALIAMFTGSEITSMLDNLYTDDIVDFIEEMPANIVQKILQEATPKQRTEINMLLRYGENTAGSIMTTDYVELKTTDTIAKAIERVKKQGNIAETVHYCYVVDDQKKLVGTISLRELILAPNLSSIDDCMDKDVIYAHTYDDQEAVALVIQKYDISVVPVVNDEQRLIGIITVDDIIDVIQQEATEDIQKMAAISPLEDSYLKVSVWKMARSRIVWLMVLMISATFTGLIMQNFEQALAANVALAFFIPMLTDTAGNAGSQAATMVTRGIAVGDLKIKDFAKVLMKELKVSFVCGVVLAFATFLRITLFMDANFMFSLVVPITVLLTVLMAKLVGGFLPFVAILLKQDPAVMASPIITTVVDALSLLVYFKLAQIFLGM